MPNDKVSKGFLWSVVLIVIILAGVWYFLSKNISQTPDSSVTNGSDASALSLTDDSDTSLAKDLQSIDASLTTVSNNSASVDNSLNDKAVLQTE